MRAEFLHLSDVHLGYQQYGHPERFNDFGRAFLAAVDYAVQHRLDFVLISGDLFHKSAIDPPTLLQAVNSLEKLRQANIPVIAIAGNHDRARYRDRYSWLDYLAERGYLALLSPDFEEAGLRLSPWDGNSGAYVDIKGVRIYGLPYLGASTRPVLEELPAVLARQSRADFTILMGHFGLDGELADMPGGQPHNAIAPLRDHIDYLALGHWHKPFEREGWIYNPGALETCAMDERHWHGGFYHVTVDTAHNPTHQAQHVKSCRRPFYLLSFPVDEYSTPQALYVGLRTQLARERLKMEQTHLDPVVEIRLEGILSFNRNDLDLEYVRKMANEWITSLLIRVKDNTRPTEFEITPEATLSRVELERVVLRDLIMRDARRRNQANKWAAVAVEVKRMALNGSAPESIATTIRQRLVGMTQKTDPASGPATMDENVIAKER